MDEFKVGDKVLHTIVGHGRNGKVRHVPAVILYLKGKVAGIAFDGSAITKTVPLTSISLIANVDK